MRTVATLAMVALSLVACESVIGADFSGTPAPPDGGPSSDAAIDAREGGAPGKLTAVACGAYHTCVIQGGKVRCFGDGKSGVLGNGKLEVGGAAPQDVDLPGPVTRIAAFNFHVCAASSREAWCWGANGTAQLGNGSAVPPSSASPVKVEGVDGEIVGIAVGVAHTCIAAESALWCWGENGLGQVGDGTTTNVVRPKKVIASDVRAVAAGSFHTCAMMVSGELRCWGLNDGRLGDGTRANKSSPTPVAIDAGTGARIDALAAGDEVTCASVRGAAYCWGENGKGTLGATATPFALSPLRIDTLEKTIALSAHEGACAVDDDGVACWGRYPGNGKTSSPVPVRLGGDLASGATAVCNGFDHACAIANGKLWCWGINPSGQLGVDRSKTPNDVALEPVLADL